MPNIDRTCQGPGATHHDACDCREAYTRRLEEYAYVLMNGRDYDELDSIRGILKADPYWQAFIESKNGNKQENT